MNRMGKYLCFILGILALVLVLSLVSGHADARTATWDGGDVDDQLASSPDNWDLNTAPVAGDNIVFDGTSVEVCTWDLATNSFGNFTIASGYSGTITQSSDMYISGYSQAGGTFTGDVTKWVYCSGNWTKTGGTFTINVARIYIENYLQINSVVLIHSIRNYGHLTINVVGFYCTFSYISSDDSVLEVLPGKSIYIYFGQAGYPTYVNGTYQSSGYVDFYTALNNANTPHISESFICNARFVADSTTRTCKLSQPYNFLTLSVFNSWAGNWLTIDLNGHNLTATTITLSVRGILTDTVGDSVITGNIVINGASACLTQGTGKAITINGDLTLTLGYLNQTGNITLNGDYAQGGGTAHGNIGNLGYWFICNGNLTLTAGSITHYTMNLNMIKNDTLLNCPSQTYFKTLKISANPVTVYTGFSSNVIIENNSVLNIPINRIWTWLGGYNVDNTILNYGDIIGLGNFIYYANQVDRTDIDFGNISNLIIRNSGVTGNKVISILDLNIDNTLTIEVVGSYTMTVNLNGHNLTASSITVGTRGILTNSQATGIVTCSAFTQSGASSQVTANIELYCSGTLTISDGVFTQGADLHIGGFSQTGGTFTGVTTKWVYCDGDFITTAGTFTPSKTNIEFVNSVYNTHNVLVFYKVVSKLNVSVIGNALRTTNLLTVDDDSVLNISLSKNVEIYYCSLDNAGLITGLGNVNFYLYGGDETVNLGTISCKLNLIVIAGSSTNPTMFLNHSAVLSVVTITSSDAVKTGTLNLNGHSLTASSITVGTRVILTNTHATTSTITATTFDSSNALGLFNGTNIILNMTGTGNLKVKATDIIPNITFQGTTTLLSEVVISNHLYLNGTVQGSYNINLTSPLENPLEGTGTYNVDIYLNGSANAYNVSYGALGLGSIFTNRTTNLYYNGGHFQIIPENWVNISVQAWDITGINYYGKFWMGGDSGNATVTMLVEAGRNYGLWVDNSVGVPIGYSNGLGYITFVWNTWSSHEFIVNPAPIFTSTPWPYADFDNTYEYDANTNEEGYGVVYSIVYTDNPNTRVTNASSGFVFGPITNTGTVTICVLADDGFGGQTYQNFTLEIHVSFWALKPKIQYDEFSLLQVKFTADCFTYINISRVWWNFGDGTGSNQVNPVHLYDKPGFYTVTLFVEDEQGRVGVRYADVEIGDPEEGGLDTVDKINYMLLYTPFVLCLSIVGISYVSARVYSNYAKKRFGGTNFWILIIWITATIILILFTLKSLGVYN